MKTSALFLVFSFLCGLLTAQDTTRSAVPAAASRDTATGVVQGRLADTSTRQQISRASLTLINTSDSTRSVRGFSDASGAFSISGVPMGNYMLRIGFQGYNNITRSFSIKSDSPFVDLGTIYMDLQANTLSDVIVVSSPRPIVIRKDTVEFNAGSFTTKPNATVEDLLNKIPGIETDREGNVKAQGEQVQRILIDGKRFFGDDPRLATRNLPPDVVDKIQVFDALTDQAEFSGFDNGERVKTINIVTRKDRRTGYFGRATAGAGNKGTFENSLSLNRFAGNRQITLIGQLNNTNRQSFTVQDITGGFNNAGGFRGGGGRGGASGGGNRGGGGSGGRGGQNPGGGGMAFAQGMPSGGNNNNGIVTTIAAGLNYRDAWGPRTEVSGSYFFNNNRVNRDQQSTTQQLLQGDSTLFSDQVQQSVNKNQNHRFNFNFETDFDSSNSLRIRPNLTVQQTAFTSSQFTRTTRERLSNVSTSQASRYRETDGINGSIDITYRHRFPKRGRTYSVGINTGINTNNNRGNNLSINNSYLPDGLTFVTDTINQRYDQTSDGKRFSGTLSYTEPVGRNAQLELNYNYSYNLNTSDRKTYNYDSVLKDYSAIDSLLSNAFENTYHSNRVTVNYQYRYQKLNFTVGTGVQFSELNSLNRTRGTAIAQRFTNLYPTANLNYQFTNTRNLRLFYSGRTNQPGVQQLQPVTDYSDPLDIERGNPALEQEFSHSFRLLYSSFHTQSQQNFFATLNFTFTNNKIANFITTVLPGTTLPADIPASTPAGAQITTPVNVNGYYNLSAFVNYGFPVKRLKSNINLATSLAHNQTINLQNNTKDLAAVKNYNRNYTIGQTLRFTTNLREGFDMNLTSTSTYNLARYTVRPDQNTRFFTQFLSVDATGYTKTGWILSTNFDYTFNSGRLGGYNTSIPLWSAYVAKQMFKNKAGELRFSVFDILNQNVSIQRNVSENYIQDIQTRVLTRYFLVSFTYNLRQFGAGGGNTPGRGNPMQAPGGMRMRMERF